MATREEVARAEKERIERNLLERARALAVRDTEAGAELTAPILTFRLSGHRYGVPLKHVLRTVRIPYLTPIPNATPFLIGVLSSGNLLVTLVDLVAMLDLPRRQGGDITGAVVVSEGARKLGLAAEELEGIQVVPQSGFRALPLEHKPFTSVVSLERGTASVLDVPALLAHPQLDVKE